MGPLNFAIALCCAAVSAAVTAPNLARRDYQPKYRISPLDGSIIALPTQEQLAFQDKEIGVLIHFNIATYISIDGCNNVGAKLQSLT